ncbi:hypothetical protein CDD82_1823 [Ophiocordyceps australis]|uniref:Methyltransferase domain-containing protein n=1 Tax=Ophiocordyceps australis TaxID=1399860 RepID=A0A2C5Y5F6_9HYPO|nr:hypothetical protein CDD82_1823 [Ophiocordyceps australis]
MPVQESSSRQPAASRPSRLSFLDIVTNKDDEPVAPPSVRRPSTALEAPGVAWTPATGHQHKCPPPSDGACHGQRDQSSYLPLQAPHDSHDSQRVPRPHAQMLPSLPQTFPEYASLASSHALGEPDLKAAGPSRRDDATLHNATSASWQPSGSRLATSSQPGTGSQEQPLGSSTSQLDRAPMYYFGSHFNNVVDDDDYDDVAEEEALTQAEDSIVVDDAGQVAADAYEDASDAGYGSEGFSSASTSAQSSIRDYLYENGRRYHRFREGAYNFPNDDLEQEREDLKHIMIKLLCGKKLHFAPIGEHPQEILDIGTGTGIWAIEMGDEYPSANLLGIDLSPIQPDWLPPNVRFVVDDVESPWLYQLNHFDYIHSRHTVMAIRDWTRLFRRAHEHLKPGGWIELQEIHHKPSSASLTGTMSAEHGVAQFWARVNEGLTTLGVDLDTAADGKLADMMRETGFVNIRQRVFHVPIGTWPKNKVLKKVGLYWRTILLDGLQAIALGPLTRGLRWNRDQIELFLMDVRRAYQDNSALMFMPLYIIYAQKAHSAVA